MPLNTYYKYYQRTCIIGLNFTIYVKSQFTRTKNGPRGPEVLWNSKGHFRLINGSIVIFTTNVLLPRWLIYLPVVYTIRKFQELQKLERKCQTTFQEILKPEDA